MPRSRSRSRDRKRRSRSSDRKQRSSESKLHSKKSRSENNTKARYYDETPRSNAKDHEEKKTDCHQLPNVPFCFGNYRSEIDGLFFTDRDVIKKASPLYEEFWKFYEKYKLMQNKQEKTTWVWPKFESDNELGVPSVFHRTFLVNMSKPYQLLLTNERGYSVYFCPFRSQSSQTREADR